MHEAGFFFWEGMHGLLVINCGCPIQQTVHPPFLVNRVVENESEHTSGFVPQKSVHFWHLCLQKSWLRGGRHDRPTSPLVKSMKNTFILFFSKTKEWKTFLMTWGLSISSEKEIKTLFEYVVQIGERGMRTGLDTLTKLQCEKVLFWP